MLNVSTCSRFKVAVVLRNSGNCLYLVPRGIHVLGSNVGPSLQQSLSILVDSSSV